jgi:hypothetical protein
MIDEKVIDGLREYLKNRYVPSHDTCGETMSISSGGVAFTPSIYEEKVCYSCCLRSISNDVSDYIKTHRKQGGFAHALNRKRIEKKLSPAELYKKANIDRRQYSRFMGPEGRHPSMNTVISFALALRLERQEFDELLQTAGYALSHSSTRDVCIMYCLENRIYTIDDVNALLFAIGIEPLTKE